jgi:hypothetical protein
MMLNWQRPLIAALALLLVLAPATPPPALAAPPDAMLYELNENMIVVPLDGPTIATATRIERRATSALEGPTLKNRALCPPALVGLLASLKPPIVIPGPTCTVTATGRSRLLLMHNPAKPGDLVPVPGEAGTVEGEFSIVVNTDNAVDSPEFVVMAGTFTGKILVVHLGSQPLPQIQVFDGSFTPATVLGDPGLAAQLGLDRPVAFSGVFRLPIPCSGTATVLRRGMEGCYLGDDGKLFRARLDELVLRVPAVRLELFFP